MSYASRFYCLWGIVFVISVWRMCLSLLIPSGVVQVSLWFQLLFWMWLYDADVHFSQWLEPIYYIAGMTAIMLVQLTGASIYFFTTSILMQYTVFIMAATMLYNIRFEFKQAICLAFLTVFLNSFYWEFFYHVYEFQIWIPYSFGFEWWYVRIPQWLRLVPAWFITRKFRITDTRPVMLGLVISFILTYLRFVWHVQNWIHPLHRIVCLILLVYTIINAERRSDG